MKQDRLRDILGLCEWFVEQGGAGIARAIDIVIRNYLENLEDEPEIMKELHSAHFNLSHARGTIDIMYDMIEDLAADNANGKQKE